MSYFKRVKVKEHKKNFRWIFGYVNHSRNQSTVRDPQNPVSTRSPFVCPKQLFISRSLKLQRECSSSKKQK